MSLGHVEHSFFNGYQKVSEVKLWKCICMRKYLRKFGSATAVGIFVISNPSAERVIIIEIFFINSFILLVCPSEYFVGLNIIIL